jgi:CheY-like chemotaxis protein
LLLNVLKHARVSEAVISLEMRDGDKWLITVEDQGIGFDPNLMRHRTADEQFGLFSIQERMEAISGWCRIHSSPGQGTRIELGLTVGNDAEAPSRENVILEPSGMDLTNENAAGTRSRVLLVDDHAMVRQGLRSILETYEDLEIIAEAVDGEAAVSLAHRLQPDVVVMDINLPRLNGIEAARRIKQAWPHIVVIGLSVQTSPQTVQALAEAGGAALLSKEQATEELYRTIQDFAGPSRKDNTTLND